MDQESTSWMPDSGKVYLYDKELNCWVEQPSQLDRIESKLDQILMSIGKKEE